MTTFEFIAGMTQALAWPTLVLALLLYYRNKIAELAIEMLGAKLQLKIVREGEAPKVNSTSPVVKNESSYFRQYTNGLLIQDVKLRIAPHQKILRVTYPITFPRELLTIQVVGEDFAWPVRTSLSNCDLNIASSTEEREIQLKISGM